MQTIDFCIAKNLAKALGFEENNEVIWRLFLSMDVMGFRYNGLDSSKDEILNGLNGSCCDFIDRLFHFLGFEKQVCDPYDLLTQPDQQGLIVVVDDFYLDYHPYFNKYHHLRHVVLTKINHHGCTIYDMQKYQLDLEILKRAMIVAFYIKESKEITLNMKDFSNKLTGYYENKRWENHSSCVAALYLFREDLKDNIAFLKKADFESLYYFINKIGGPTQTRKLMTISLRNLLDDVGNHQGQLHGLTNMMAKLTSEWDTLGNMFFRMSRRCHESMYEGIFKRLDGIIDMEIRLENL